MAHAGASRGTDADPPASHRSRTYNLTVQSTPTDRFRDLTLDEFVGRLASAEPVPGGGSASAVAASLGAGLVAMVASLSEGRPKYAEHADLLAVGEGQRPGPRGPVPDARGRRRRGLRRVRRRDEAAARDRRGARPRGPPRCRRAARHAAEVPLACVEACLELVGAAEALAGRSNVNASSDLNVAVAARARRRRAAPPRTSSSTCRRSATRRSRAR